MSFVLAVCAMVFPAMSFAQSARDPRKPASREWLTIGGDWHNTRYSTLTQINVNNVKNLKGAWVSHLGSGLGQKYSFEGTPSQKWHPLYCYRQ
jgi:glucose dehydrogenase